MPKKLRWLLASLALLSLAGCVGTGLAISQRGQIADLQEQLDAVSRDAGEAQQSADEAKSAADDAGTTADEAKQEADDLDSKLTRVIDALSSFVG